MSSDGLSRVTSNGAAFRHTVHLAFVIVLKGKGKLIDRIVDESSASFVKKHRTLVHILIRVGRPAGASQTDTINIQS